jgi:hypothetical protein
MSCDDLDRLRAESPHSASSGWPREAQQHLASCGRCSQLQASLDSSAQLDFPEALRGRIEADILPGLRPVSPIPSTLRVAVTLLLCSMVVIAAANLRLGLDGWYARSRLQASVNFSLLGVSILALANALAQQMMPGSRRRASVSLYIAVPLLALLAANVSVFGYRWNPNFVPIALSCWEIGVACAALSAPLFWMALRRGFSLDPVGHGATAGLLAGLVGATVLEIYCPYLDRLHTSAAHVGAAITSALLGAVLGGIKGRIERRAA